MSYLGWRKYRSDKDRILKNVIKSGNGCWLWSMSKDKDGYGRVYSLDNRTNRAHILSYIVYKGDYDRSLLICHKCNNPSCVNPEHLYAGTNKDNMLDRELAGKGLTGENNPKNKLSARDVLEIRQLAPYFTNLELGAIYGIWPSAIHKIKHKLTWRNL